MAVKFRRPILVGGVSLSFSLWLWQSFHHSAVEVGEFGVLAALGLGTGVWWWQQLTAKNAFEPETDSQLNRETIEKAIALTNSAIIQLQTEAENHQNLPNLQQRVASLTTELERQEKRIAVTGGKGAGKTTLRRVLAETWVPQQQQKICLSETPALFTADEMSDTAALEVARGSDLVLFLTTGDLTSPEFLCLQQLAAENRRIMLIFNKQDQYLPEERPLVLQQLKQRVQGILRAEDVVACAAAPGMVKVRQHQPTGGVQERMEQPAPEITQLAQQLSEILVRFGQQLVWASTYRAAVAIKAEALTVLNEVRRDRALPVIEQYQWIAAATAFANPIAALDLLATAAITAQLVIDLGEVYQQKFGMGQAQAAAKTLGSLMIKLGLVELSTSTIAGILKSNAITYVAGGVVQGVSAAYLTRLAGLSLIEYFQSQEIGTTADGGLLNIDKLRQTLQNVFQANQRGAFLQSFVKQAVGRLMPESP